MRLATQSAYSRARNISAMCRGVGADFEIARGSTESVSGGGHWWSGRWTNRTVHDL